MVFYYIDGESIEKFRLISGDFYSILCVKNAANHFTKQILR